MRVMLLALALIVGLGPPGAPAHAFAPPARARDVIITLGPEHLGATLTLPQTGAPPYPAVVLVHGSGAATRRSLAYLRDQALALGLATLAYDKRGTGVSSGVYQRFSVAGSERIFADLAQDAAAAHRWLAAQPEIDPARVGYLGASQAGWIMPLAAEETGAAFLIAAGGPTVSAGAEAYHADMTWEGARELSDRALREADRRVRRFSGETGFDPRAALERVEAPALWIYGTEDAVIPVNPSIAALERLARAGHANHEVRLIEGMDHGFRLASGERVALAEIARDWLAEIGVTP